MVISRVFMAFFLYHIFPSLLIIVIPHIHYSCHLSPIVSIPRATFSLRVIIHTRIQISIYIQSHIYLYVYVYTHSYTAYEGTVHELREGYYANMCFQIINFDSCRQYALYNHHTHIRIHTNTNKYTYTYIHTSTYTHTRTHTLFHIHVSKKNPEYVYLCAYIPLLTAVVAMPILCRVVPYPADADNLLNIHSIIFNTYSDTSHCSLTGSFQGHMRRLYDLT